MTTDSVKTMARYLDNRNNTMDEIDMGALQYLILPESC